MTTTKLYCHHLRNQDQTYVYWNQGTNAMLQTIEMIGSRQNHQPRARSHLLPPDHRSTRWTHHEALERSRPKTRRSTHKRSTNKTTTTTMTTATTIVTNSKRKVNAPVVHTAIKLEKLTLEQDRGYHHRTILSKLVLHRIEAQPTQSRLAVVKIRQTSTLSRLQVLSVL